MRLLRQASRRLAGGELDARVADEIGQRRDEIAELGRDFDYMATRLQALVAAQRTLLHDVSHELRSPLARLQVAVGLARQQPEKTSTMLERIERETERLGALVGEVLTLSRLEAGVIPAATECVNLRTLLEDVVADARFEAAPEARAVTLRGSDELLLECHPDLLRRAFDNIVRNAVRHTARGTAVAVELAPGGHSWLAVVRVCDRGPGLAEAELPAVFEPFVRGRGSAGHGYGLGPAIAKRAIQAHGGSIAARNRAQGGICVEVRLPQPIG